ncbi:MAG: CBS domain-containing protein [Ignavibacteriae bacterium]|nr:CBS domain-containing protein [Ignavibacteriota bacterium]
MKRNVAMVGSNVSVKEAAEKMRTANVGILPVGEHNQLVGMLSDRDITVRATAEGRDPARTTVREIMSDRVYYCFEEQDIADAATIMMDRNIRRLIVLNQKKQLVGICSLSDLLEQYPRKA